MGFAVGEVVVVVMMMVVIMVIMIMIMIHHHHQKAFRNKSHTSHGHRPGLKRNKSKGKRLTSN